MSDQMPNRDTQRQFDAWDTRLIAALEDVPVPAGLAERLLAATRAATSTVKSSGEFGGEPVGAPAVPTEAGGEVVPSGARPAAEPRIRRRLGRRAWGAMIGVTAASALAIWWTFHAPQPAPLTEMQLVSAAGQWASELEGLQWERSSPAPEARPASRHVRFGESPRWATLGLPMDTAAVAYQNSAGSVTLFTLETSLVGELPVGMPPLPPQGNTGALCVGAWREGSLVYVLVVRGDTQRYQRSLARPRSA